MGNKKSKHLIESRGERIFNVVMNILGVVITLVVLYPIFYTVIASISRPFFVENGSVMFRPMSITFESYKKAFNTEGLWTAYGNTFLYTFGGLLVNMFFTTTMAYALSKKRLLFRKFFTLFTVFTMWFSAGLIPLYMTFRDFHLLNTRTAIIFGFAINTYNLVILKSFFEQLPESLEEAAFIDGANNFTIFWKVFLPLSKPALATVGLFYAVNRWNSYFWAMNLLKDDNKMPLQVLLKKLIVDQQANASDAVAVTASSLSSPTTIIYATVIIAIVPMLLVFPFVQKYFKTGVTLGAVKG